MNKEFDEKIQEECFGNDKIDIIPKEDVKEFIKIEDRLLTDLEYGRITMNEFCKERVKLLGEKLCHQKIHYGH
jgi:hypothetical protein